MALKYNQTRFNREDVEIIERTLSEAGKPMTAKQIFRRIKKDPNFSSAVKAPAFGYYLRHGAINCSGRYALYDVHQGSEGEPLYERGSMATLFIINHNKEAPSEQRTSRLKHPMAHSGPRNRTRSKKNKNNMAVELTSAMGFPSFIGPRFINGLVNRAKSIDEFWHDKTPDQKKRIFYADLRNLTNSFLEENES
tara:strand:+ start:74 stop:655 length:582 start_codon:yes stop_codon:yes gene_type:complete